MADSLGIAGFGSAVAARKPYSAGRSARLTFKQALARAGQFGLAKARAAKQHHARAHPASLAPSSGVSPFAAASYTPVVSAAAVPAAAAASRPAARLPAIPEATDAALTQAMQRENVPESWRPGLHYIMQRESGGRVDVRNPVHSARGLFQLTRANYHLNPNGAASFGNGVEEAQGGIRYIKARYGTPDRAVAHWQTHRWY